MVRRSDEKFVVATALCRPKHADNELFAPSNMRLDNVSALPSRSNGALTALSRQGVVRRSDEKFVVATALCRRKHADNELFAPSNMRLDSVSPYHH